jgi:hypothetical protein
MTKTKKNVQKKRRLQKKTRGFGKGNGANSASNRASAASIKHNRSLPAYVPTEYTVKLGNDNSEFKHLFEKDPAGPASDVHYDLFKAINKYRDLPEKSKYPITTLNAWHYELKKKPDGTQYVFVPKNETW